MEKLALALVLLITRSQALSEASRNLTGKAFIFAEESTAHVKLVPAKEEDFTAVTVCLRYFSDLSRGHMDMFAMSSGDHSNGFQMYVTQSKYHVIGVGDADVQFLDMPHKQNEWNSFCGTWDSGTGLTQVWVNGRHSRRKYAFTGKSLAGPHTSILGQDQHRFLWFFFADHNFVGELTDVHMWDSVLSPCEIQSYMKGMNFKEGNVINWQDLEYTADEKVVVGELQTQCSETCSKSP